MSVLQTDTLVSSSGDNLVNAPEGITVNGEAFTSLSFIPWTEVTSEAELDAALSAGALWIKIKGSIAITSTKALYNGLKLEGMGNQYTMSPSGLSDTEPLLSIGAGVSNVIIKNVSMTSLISNAIEVADTAIKNNIRGCAIDVDVATTKSAVEISGQRNRVWNNFLTTNGSVSSQGTVFLTGTAQDTLITTNIIL